MEKKKLQQLALKYADKKATKKEKKFFEAFLDQMQEVNKKINPKLNDAKKEWIFKTIEQQLYGSSSAVYKNILWIAAAVTLLFGLSFYAANLGEDMVTVAAARGEMKKINLNDGSIVLLNGNSKFSYAQDFKDNRNTKLTGEAFFQVSPDTKHPFTVQTNLCTTKVLGTSFNIKAYHDDHTTVSVNAGRVRVIPNQIEEQFTLTENQQIRYKKGLKPELTQRDSEDFNAWTRKTIVLNNTSLQQTADILENWYDVRIKFAQDSLKKERITGKFRDETLETVLKSIALIKNLKIDSTHQNHILIRANTN